MALWLANRADMDATARSFLSYFPRSGSWEMLSSHKSVTQFRESHSSSSARAKNPLSAEK